MPERTTKARGCAAPRGFANLAAADGVSSSRSSLLPNRLPVSELSRLARGQGDVEALEATSRRLRQWYQVGDRIEVAAASSRKCWGPDRLKFFIEFKRRRVLVSEPFKDSILELCPTATPRHDFIQRYFTEVGSGWCCNAPGAVTSDASDPSAFIYTPNIEALLYQKDDISSIIERQLGVLAGETEPTRQWLDIISQESTTPECEDVNDDLQRRLDRDAWLRDRTASCGYTAERSHAMLLFPRCLGDKVFVGAALFSQHMLALHARLDTESAPMLQWQGSPPIALSVNDSVNCLIHRWRLDHSMGFFPVPNPSFRYNDIAYSGMGARLDAWWEECQLGYPSPSVTAASIAEQAPPRLRYTLHRLEDGLSIDAHFPQGHPRHQTVEGIIRSGKDYRYRETSADGMVGYEDISYYPPLWLARSAHAAAALASAPSAALAQRLATIRKELISRFGSPALEDEDDDMQDDDGEPLPNESVSDYVLLLALMPRFHDFSRAPQRVWLPMQLLSSDEADWQ